MVTMRSFVITSLALVLVVVGEGPSLRAQGKGTLWTDVSADGRRLSLTWHKSHPWDEALRKDGAELRVRYPTGSREATEGLGRGTADSKNPRHLTFSLPETLSSDVVGSVCLFLQTPARRAVPVRRATVGDADTAGFRYEAWERQLRQATDLRVVRARVQSVSAELDAATARVDAQERRVADLGASDVAACEQLSVPVVAPGPRPPDVIDPPAQDAAARRVCVMRAANGFATRLGYAAGRLKQKLAAATKAQDAEAALEALSLAFSPAFSGPLDATPRQLVEGIAAALGPGSASLNARRSELTTFVRDWGQFVTTLKDYQPPLGDSDEYLGWPSTARGVALRVFGRDLASRLNVSWAVQDLPEPTTRDLESILGSALDAYAGCVDDGVKQLAIKYRNWQDLRSAAPQRAAAAREFLVRECRQELRTRDTLKARQAELQAQLALERAAVERLQVAVQLPARPVVLNGESCRQAR